MGKISEFTAQDHEVIARDYADLLEAARKRCSDAKELEIIQKAFDFANEAHKGVRRRSGEPYILHPIAVAKIVVSNIGLGYKSIVAALLHDVVEDTDYTVDDLRSLFGDKVATLVDGLTKIKAYCEYQRQHENDILKPGTAFPLIKALHKLNADGKYKNYCKTCEALYNLVKEKIPLFGVLYGIF